MEGLVRGEGSCSTHGWCRGGATLHNKHGPFLGPGGILVVFLCQAIRVLSLMVNSCRLLPSRSAKPFMTLARTHPAVDMEDQLPSRSVPRSASKHLSPCIRMTLAQANAYGLHDSSSCWRWCRQSGRKKASEKGRHTVLTFSLTYIQNSGGILRINN